MKKKIKIGTIIECRMGSTRLPGKVTLPIMGKPALLKLVERVRRIKPKTEIILATTHNKKDNEIVRLAKKENLKYFRGSEKNVFKRVIEASKKYNIDVINTVCGDCILLDPIIISEALKKYFALNKEKVVDILCYDKLPHGFDCTIVNAKKLINSYKYAKSSYDKDNPTFAMRKKPREFKKFSLIAKREIQNHGTSFALDYWEDYALIKIIFHRLEKNKPKFGIKDVLNLIKHNSKLGEINKNLKKNFYPEITWWK